LRAVPREERTPEYARNGVLPSPKKEEAPKEEGKPLSKDNEPKTEKAKGGKGKSSVLQKNARAREKAMTAIERAEHNRKRFLNLRARPTAPKRELLCNRGHRRAQA
jgi:hypothetical protein